MKTLKKSIPVLVCLILLTSCGNKENQYLIVEGRESDGTYEELQSNFSKVEEEYCCGELGAMVNIHSYKGNIFTGEKILIFDETKERIGKTISIFNKGIKTSYKSWDVDNQLQLVMEQKSMYLDEGLEVIWMREDLKQELIDAYSADLGTSAEGRNSNSYTSTNASNSSYQKTETNCPNCHKKYKFQTWTGNRWKWIEETKIGSVKCSGCAGYGYTEHLDFVSNTTTKKECYVGNCNNGWTRCSKCYGKGTL